MSNRDLDKSISILSAALDRFYCEGNSQRQEYSLKDVLNLAIGFPVADKEALIYLINRLKEWEKKGFIELNQENEKKFIKVINPDFS